MGSAPENQAVRETKDLVKSKVARPAERGELQPVRSMPAARVLDHRASLRLQRTVGNAAAAALLRPGASLEVQRDDDDLPTAVDAGATDTATTDTATTDTAVPELEPPKAKSDAPEHPAKPRPKMDLAGGQEVLTKAFGGIKKIVPGSIQVLDPAAFQVAYDKIYGSGDYSWAKYVAPKYGSLNGFAYDNVNYINKGSAGLHTVVHEMLHNNTAADWRGVVGSRWDEGTTEVLTKAACDLFAEPAPVCYPGESPVVREALASGLPIDDLTTAYLNGGAQKKVAEWVDANCIDNWAAVKSYMELNQWAAAKAGLAKRSGPIELGNDGVAPSGSTAVA